MKKHLLDRGWKFIGSDASGSIYRAFNKSGAWLSGAQSRCLDDSDWETVDLPHDYVINGTPQPAKGKSEVITDIPEMQTMDSMLTANGSLERRVAWYRKHFFIGKESDGKRIFIRFDGVFRNSEFYFNGFYLDRHMSGYTPITIELTDFIEYGGDNVIAVKVDPRIPEGWWYEGGGIYRHVWLIETPTVSVTDEDIFVSSELSDDKSCADIKTEVCLNNSDDENAEIKLSLEIFDETDKCVARQESKVSVGAYSDARFISDIKLSNPRLWDIDEPYLYKLKVAVGGGNPVTVNFGIRKAIFDPKRGFMLNGKSVKLKGVCMHQDHAGLGAALFDGMWEYRLKKLKEMGCNAYRAAHNPPSPELLDACDRLGILVMDETRLLSSSPEDLSQLRALIKRDRNHPSVIIYSVGNEEIHIQFKDCAEKIIRRMKNEINKLDGTRSVTEALLLWDTKNNIALKDISLADKVAKSTDVIGVNYNDEIWDALHKAYPDKPFIVTESAAFPSTRGCMETESELCRLGLADKSRPKYGEGQKEWKAVAENSYISGSFIWTGFDYRGEPTPFGWPAVSSQFGVFDLCGFKKDAFYFYKSYWKNDASVHICGDWNYKNGYIIPEIWCFTNCDCVELFVGKNSIGKKAAVPYEPLVWHNTEFVKGEVRAVGYKGDVKVCEHIIKTSGDGKKLCAKVDFQCSSDDGREYAVINVKMLDGEGIFVSDADDILRLKPHNCSIISVGNGNPLSHTPAKADWVRLFNGCTQVILQKEQGQDAELAAECKRTKNITVNF